MADSIQVSAILAATPERLYRCWLNGREHAKVTGRSVRMEPREGSEFTLDDGAVVGTTRLLEPARRIVQSLRDERFEDDAPDSLVEVMFEPVGDTTRVTLTHSDLPRGAAARFKRDWQRELEAMKTSFDAAQAKGRFARDLKKVGRRLFDVAEEVAKQAKATTVTAATRATSRPQRETPKAKRTTTAAQRTEPPLEKKREAATRAKRTRQATPPNPTSKRTQERTKSAERQRSPQARPRPGKAGTGRKRR